MEDNKKRIVVIGIGNCGCQVAALATKKYGALFDAVYINTSAADLSMVPDDGSSVKFKIDMMYTDGQPNPETGEQPELKKKRIEGSGKNRGKMKEYLHDAIQPIFADPAFSQCVAEKKYGFVIASAAGGTGSGAAPIMMEFLRRLFPDTYFVLVTVLPQISASMMEQGNALEFLSELYEVMDSNTTYMVYDNESTNGLPPTKALETVNEQIVEDLRVLSGVDNFPTPYESIDEADMESIITTPGRLLVCRLTKGLTEKALEDSDLDEMMVKAIKQSAHAETDRNRRVVRWGLITYLTDGANRLYSPSLPGLQDFIGVPIECFNHNAVNPKNENLNFIYMVAAGLSPINDRVRRITDRVDELRQALATDESSKYILSGDSTSYEALATRRKEERRARQVAEVKPEDIFKKFMK